MSIYDDAKQHGEATPEDRAMEQTQGKPIYRVHPATEMVNGKSLTTGYFRRKGEDGEYLHEKNLNAVFLGMRYPKVYFPIGAEKPTCRSDFGGIGVGDPGGDCRSCPLMAFNVKDPRNRDRCKNQVHYVFYVPGAVESLEVVEVSVSAGAIRESNNALGKFQNEAMKSGAKPYAILVELGTTETPNAAGQASSFPLTVTPVRALTPDEYARAEVLFRECQSWIRAGNEAEGVRKALPAATTRPELPAQTEQAPPVQSQGGAAAQPDYTDPFAGDEPPDPEGDRIPVWNWRYEDLASTVAESMGEARPIYEQYAASVGLAADGLEALLNKKKPETQRAARAVLVAIVEKMMGGA